MLVELFSGDNGGNKRQETIKILEVIVNERRSGKVFIIT